MRRGKAAIILVLTGDVLLFAFLAPVIYVHIDKTSCYEGICQETLENGYQSIALNLTEQIHALRYGGVYANTGGQPWTYWIFWNGQSYKITS